MNKTPLSPSHITVSLGSPGVHPEEPYLWTQMSALFAPPESRESSGMGSQREIERVDDEWSVQLPLNHKKKKHKYECVKKKSNSAPRRRQQMWFKLMPELFVRSRGQQASHPASCMFLPRHRPSPEPYRVFLTRVDTTDTDNLSSCAACANQQMWMISLPDYVYCLESICERGLWVFGQAWTQ